MRKNNKDVPTKTVQVKIPGKIHDIVTAYAVTQGEPATTYWRKWIISGYMQDRKAEVL